MFDVAKAFRLSIFVLATLSAVMLALAEGDAFPNVLTVPFAIAAYMLTVSRNGRGLPTWGANLLAVLALLFAGGEWGRAEFTSDVDSVMLARLVAGTHLLIYLMWIVLFQHKTQKHYWWMFALSLLQVAVGSVLTDSGFYGVLLFGYLFGAIWTLSLFTLHIARQDLKRPTGPAALARPERGKVIEPPQGERADVSPGQSLLQPSRVVWENRAQGWRQHAVDVRFVWGTCGTALASLCIAFLFFLLVPRVWIGKLPALRGGSVAGIALSLTGFTEEVRLGSTGQILESNERVLFVRVFDVDGSEMGVEEYARELGYDEPLFRGAVLANYADGRWSAGRMGDEPIYLIPERNPKDLIRQEVRLVMSNSNFVFAMHPVIDCQSPGSSQLIQYRPFSTTLIRNPDGTKKPVLEYSIYSPPSLPYPGPPSIPEPRPTDPRTPWRNGQEARRAIRRYERMMEQCREFPNQDGKLSRLQSLARRVAEYDPDAPGNKLEMAKRLESHLRDSGEFGYSLNSSVVDVDDDPVEDFLFNRKQGHCEYYAAALALMLRSVDIPARLVNGFKGGSVNRLSGEFYVEQRHAHAWVEALIDGRWVTLDATPALARSESVAGLAPAVDSWNDLINMIKEQWSTSIVSMDIMKQKEKFYVPIQASLLSTWNSLKDTTDGNTNLPKSIGKFFSSPENWFSWQGAVATAVLLSFISSVVYGIRKLWRIGGHVSQQGDNRRTMEQVRIEFYERFRALCRTLGLVRGDAQTEREFLVAVDHSIQPQLAAAGLEQVPAELVKSFYEVRFGGREIDAELQQRVESQLTAMETVTSEFQRQA